MEGIQITREAASLIAEALLEGEGHESVAKMLEEKMAKHDRMARYVSEYSFQLTDLPFSSVRWLEGQIDVLKKEHADTGSHTIGSDKVHFYGSTISDDLIELLSRYLCVHDKTGSIAFEYSMACNYFRPDSFSGGAYFITATEARHIHTHQWVEARAQEHENNYPRKPAQDQEEPEAGHQRASADSQDVQV